MDADQSLVDIFQRLESWARLPKYALERRLDIFLTPFLEEFLTRETGAPVTLVVPEFPILSEIALVAPSTPGLTPMPLGAVSARTVNADFLLRRGGPDPAWILLELKTDAASIGRKQLDRYVAAQRVGMAGLLDHLRTRVLASTASRHDPRYGRVIAAVERYAADRVEIVYLAPQLVHGLRPAAEALAAGDRRSARCHLLRDFAASGPYRHAALWERVRRLIEGLERPEGAGPELKRSA